MKRWLRRHQQSLTLGTAGAVIVAAAAVPLLLIAREMLTGAAGMVEALYRARLWLLLGRSLLVAAAVTVVALLLGVPMGAMIGRTDLPGRRLLLLVHAFPIFLPPFLIALGWFHLFGRSGFLGSELSSGLLFSGFGLIADLGITFAPIVSSLTALAVVGVDPSLEDAARTVGRPFRVTTRILIPAARPALILAAIVVFALAFSEIGVPMFLRVTTYQAAVFSRLGGIEYAPGEAFALALPLIPIAVLLLALEQRLVGVRSYAVLGLRGAVRTPLPLGRWRGPLATLCWLEAVFASLPVAALLLRAWRGGFAELPSWTGSAPWNSLAGSAMGATIIAVLGLVLGHASARRIRGARWLDGVAVLTFLTPAAVVGVGLVATWNRPVTGTLYGSAFILVVGYVARYAVIGLRTAACAVAQSPLHFEEAAAVAGAGFIRRLLRVVIPIHARGILATWFLAMVFCLRDLEMSVLYYPAGREPLTVRIFSLEANGPEPVVAALATLHVGITALVVAAGGILLWRRRRRQ